MKMQSINLSIPDDLVFELKSIPHRGATVDDKLRFSLAVGMFVSGDISLAKAAQVADKNLGEFMSLLKSLNIPAFVYTEDMLEDDLRFAKA
jgi:predicted HTH domain antitoxin